SDGAFGDVVSGPHAIGFTPDGAYALVVDASSEDVLAIDARTGVEAALLRPLPGHQPEGIAVAPDGSVAYIDERNTGDVAVVRIDRGAAPAPGLALGVDGPPIPRFAVDPMPPALRLGQHLFSSANSDEYPITQNHWVACASCHLEGRSDAVTWRFLQGPRDTPSNAGGMRDTGFLFRTAARTRVQDYWHTIQDEQGGALDPAADAALLDALAAYVDLGIPLPVPPTTDPALVAQGRAIFERADVGCATCHGGPRFTDSGQGNPALDLGGEIRLHDVGTCVTTGAWPDAASADLAGHPRTACAFDTPSLSGVAASAPYLHDGSAPTLHDVLERTRGTMGDISSLSPGEEAALVEYLRSL
ncbi:MAG TPA: di-heme oxidoredictase family protein, partial [Kofleriaceae bacterium]|nr:di-heme oxidoredictase family protein [Kofleriaceae bacterium]